MALLSVRLWRYASSEDGAFAWVGSVVVGRALSDCLLFKFIWLDSGYLVLETERTLLCPGGALDLDLDVDLALGSGSRERDRDKAGRGVTDRIVAMSGLGTRGDWI